MILGGGSYRLVEVIDYLKEGVGGGRGTTIDLWNRTELFLRQSKQVGLRGEWGLHKRMIER